MKEIFYGISDFFTGLFIPTVPTDFIVNHNYSFVSKSKSGKWLYYKDFFTDEKVKVSAAEQRYYLYENKKMKERM